MVVGLLIGAAGGFGIYRRFGFVYAAVGSMACAAAIPFQLDLSATVRHMPGGGDSRVGVRRRAIETPAVSGRLSRRRVRPVAGGGVGRPLPHAEPPARAWDDIGGWFYWCTYVMTWVLPVVGLGLGIREKDRALMDVSLVMALVTLITNKPYLGWPRHTWDPILLGVFLMAVALALRRWLSNGPDGARDGFTSARILNKDSAVLTLLRATSATFQPDAPASRPDPVTSRL